MGDIADAVLDGEMCEGCGEWLGGGDGHPRTCAGCSGGDDDPEGLSVDDFPSGDFPRDDRPRCLLCGKRRKSWAAVMRHLDEFHVKPRSMRRWHEAYVYAEEMVRRVVRERG